jgi:hypothetical protein
MPLATCLLGLLSLDCGHTIAEIVALELLLDEVQLSGFDRDGWTELACITGHEM